MDVLLHDSKPLTVRGFATVFGRTAETEHGTEMIRQGAFADSLKSGQDIVATWGHDHYFTWARTGDGSLRLWETDVGLAFEATIESSLRGRGLADFIAGGSACASITLVSLDHVETAVGKEVIRANLEEICVYTSGAYPTACWLAGDAQPDTLTARCRDLRRRWTAERQAPRHAMPSAATRARRTAAQPELTDEEVYGPAPSGMSMEEWLDFGRSCAHGAKWCK